MSPPRSHARARCLVASAPEGAAVDNSGQLDAAAAGAEELLDDVLDDELPADVVDELLDDESDELDEELDDSELPPELLELFFLESSRLSVR